MKIFCIHPGASTSTADVYTGIARALESQGHELVKYNLDRRIMQAGGYLRWVHKNVTKSGVAMDKPTPADSLYWSHADAIMRAHMTECDMVLIFSAMYTPRRIIKAIRRTGIKVGIVFTESPYDDEKQLEVARFAHICWTNERSSLDYLRIIQPNTFYLPHGYDPEIHTFRHPDEGDVRAHDVVFVGTGFYERVEMLSSVDWTDIDFGLYGIWQHLGSRSKLRPFLEMGEIPNLAASALYHRAKIGLNLFRTSKGFGRYAARVEGAESLNPRSYELAACGLFHLSEYRPELTDVFGTLVPTFRTGQELTQKIRYFLAHESERKAIARLLPDAVKGHTWADRTKLMMEQVGHIETEKELARG